MSIFKVYQDNVTFDMHFAQILCFYNETSYNVNYMSDKQWNNNTTYSRPSSDCDIYLSKLHFKEKFIWKHHNYCKNEIETFLREISLRCNLKKNL